MRRDLGIFGAYFAQFLKTRMAYRADFFAEIGATVLGTAASLAFVLALFSRIDDLNGWHRNEILFVYGLSLVPYGIFAMVSWNLYEFGDHYIIEGNFDRVLLRPVSPLCQVLFESFRVHTLAESLVGIGIVVATAAALDLAWTPFDVVWLLVAFVSGALIFVAVFGAVASLSFHFEDRIGIAPPVFNLITAGRYPIDVFNPLVRFLLRWIVPFAFVAFYPSTHLLGHEEFRHLCMLSPLVALLSLAVFGVFWRIGVRAYTSTGS
jgi:ABC-2 type transport system permease protein